MIAIKFMHVALAGIFITSGVTACDDRTAPPVVARSALADSADQVMFGARFNLTDKGLSRAEMLSDTAFFSRTIRELSCAKSK